MERSLLLDDATRILHALAAAVALDHVQALDRGAVLLGDHLQDLAGLAALASRDDQHGVALLEPRGQPYRPDTATRSVLCDLTHLKSRPLLR